MKAFVTCLAVLGMTTVAMADAQIVIDFEAPTYAVGNLPGQDGWSQIVGTDPSAAYVLAGDNGPALPGNQYVDFLNIASEIRVERSIGDMVAAGGPIVTMQYDVKDLRNMLDPNNVAPDWSTTLFRVRGYDSVKGVAAVGNMHYDGGGGPACQAAVGFEPDGDPKGYSPIGDPVWYDRDWHTVAWKFNYATKQFYGLSFDGVWVDHPNEWFYDWPGQADTLDLIRVWLNAYDLNDNWGLDNIIVTATPEPASLALLALGGLAMLRRRR